MTISWNYDDWLANDTAVWINIPARAVSEWRRIQDQPITISVYRNGAFSHDAIVRVEMSNFSLENIGGSSVSETNLRFATVFGVRDHPNPAVVDTDLIKGDLFSYDGESFEVQNVIYKPGEIQARAIRSS